MKPQRGKTPKKTPGNKRKKELDPVEVYGRIRPINEDVPLCVKVTGSTTIQLKPPEGSNAARNGVAKESEYKFKFVFDDCASQKAVFDQTALPLAEDILKGKNALLFAYGITSSGKTHTMMGEPQDQGILPRSLDVIFNSIANLQAKKYVFKPDKMNGYDVQSDADAMMERQRRDILPGVQGKLPPKDNSEKISSRIRDTSKVDDVEEDNNYAVFVSYVEIYNNYIYDLLEDLQHDPITGYRQPTSKILREDSTRNMYVSGVTETEVKSTEDAYQVLLKGQKRRKVANTALNHESSRSHSVFSIRLVQAPLDPLGEEVLLDKDKILVSQLSLVDLAGSERTKRTGNQGERLREAGSINQSLMVLRTCIETLRENQVSGGNKMVPYRDSRLTHLFKNHFDGEGKVRMVVCVNPKAVEYDETIHVMQFAEMTQDVQVARSTQVRFDVGLEKGRRRMNQKYKESLAQAKSNGEDPVEVPIPPPMIYSLGNMFPRLDIAHADEGHIAATLIEFLKERKARREALLHDYGVKQERFRQRLLHVEDENRTLNARVQELESKLNDHSSDTNRMASRIRSLEKANSQLTRTTTVIEQEKRQLAKEIDDKEFRIHQEKIEKDRIYQDYRAHMALKEHQFNKQMEKTKRSAHEEAAARVRAERSKMRQIKHIVDADRSDTDSVGGYRARAHTVASSVLPARSEPDLSKPADSGYGLRGAHKRAMTAYTNSVKQSRTTRARSPPPTKPKPVLPNPRHHRRSRSAHEVWVDHRPESVVDTGAVLQSKMKKKRSVTNLNEKDTKRATNYALTTQEVDSEGDIATKVVKGDIHRTSGGGTAVVFKEVETLKQKSPGDRKRRSPPLRPEDFDGEWTDAEERCRIAIEGHGQMKKIKTSRV